MKKYLIIACLILALGCLLNASTVITGDISTDTTLYMSNNPHQIRGTVRVLDGATLTLEPGVNVLFENNSILEIQGAISAMGTVTLPIWFHSIDGDQHYTKIYLNGAEGSTFSRCAFSRSRDNSGLLRIENSGTINVLNCNLDTTVNSHGIFINNSTVNINYTSIAGVAYNGIQIQGSSTVNLFDVSVDGCQTGIYVTQNNYTTLNWDNIEILHSSSYPLYASIFHYAVLGGLSVSWADIDMLAMWESSLYSSLTLPYKSLPYFVLNNLNLNSGAVLTLEPGVGLRFAEHGLLSLAGGSSLNADGTILLPISFRAGGAYTWKGIRLESNCSALLDYCQFSSCGYPQYGYDEPTIYGNSVASLSISNTTIPGGTTYGIYLTGGVNGTVNLDNVNIQNCPYTGLCILDSSITLGYNNLFITDCGRPLAIPANLLNFLDEQPLFTDNADNRIFLQNDGYIYRNTTVRNWGYPYVCESIDINVNNVDLSIDPGCEFQFGYALGFYVNGTITAVGTSTDPVLFTKLPGSTQNWRGFYLNSGTSYAHFNHCIVQHCSSGNQYGHVHDAFTLYRADTVLIENTQIIDAWCRAVYLESSNSDADDLVINNLSIDGCGMDAIYQNASGYNLTINGLSVNNCNAFPVSVSANWAHQIGGFTLTNNAHNVIRFVNGGYLASQTLSNHGYPYQISGGHLYVNYTNVSFLPGTVFYFEQERSLEVSGTLTAIGTASQPIIFDRPPDASYFWERIYLYNGSSASFEHCQFLNSGRRTPYGYDNAFLDNAGATLLSLQNCQIINVDAQAISCHDAGSGDAVQISNVQIDGCRTDGFWCNNSNFTLSVDNFSVSNCLRNPISILAMHAGCFGNLSLSGNASNDIRLFGYNGINGAAHFPNHGYVYRCEEGLYGNGGSSISFAPGCVFWIADNRSLTFNGAVSAIGTADQPIIFTRYPASTNYWLGVWIYSASWDADFEHCQFLYGGAQETYGARRAFSNNGAGNLNISNCLIQNSFGDGFVVLDTQNTDLLSISNLQILDVAGSGFVSNTSYHDMNVNGLSITNCGSWPIYSSVDLLDKLTNVAITNPGTAYIGIGAATQTRSATWPNFGLPYKVNGALVVNDWVTLDISAGTEIIFTDYLLYYTDPRFMVYGALNVLGAADNPVTMRGLDIYAPSTWKGLRIYNPDGVCSLNYLNLFNAGLDEGDTPSEEFCALYIYNGTVNLTGCRVGIGNHNLMKLDGYYNTTTLTNCLLDSAVNGIIHNNGILNLSNNTIQALSGTGILQYGGTLNFGAGPSQWNRIYGNTLNLRNNTAAVINAPYVYWGSVDPDVIDTSIWDNEEGTGMVNFEPWYDINCQTLYYYTLGIPQDAALVMISPTLLRLSWGSVPSATSYKVLVASTPDAADWDILQQNIGGTTLDITPVAGDPHKFYKVVAIR
jgi:hypothetical protein